MYVCLLCKYLLTDLVNDFQKLVLFFFVGLNNVTGNLHDIFTFFPGYSHVAESFIAKFSTCNQQLQ
jgi:hypothetical protein